MTDVYGLNGVTYFPHLVGSRMHPGTARFLATVGLPSSKLFSTRLDLDTPDRLECRPSLKAAFDADGANLPEGSEQWEILGEFQYATVALDPRTGQIYSFAEGEEFYVPMHQDVSSLVHTLTVAETGLTEVKELPHHDDQARAEAVEALRERITQVDQTPFASEDGEWSRFFEEVALDMWG
ncbi:SUKH-4 family immunity protein [Streptomyces aureus]|uniref:SUKH-4 family immunity protein n=1 Tax=Streptomyces aureus TaxID=193461 RepID=UPI0006E248C7|nr:SUKH-4 family immunity protein [Streptomyces aureus]